MAIIVTVVRRGLTACWVVLFVGLVVIVAGTHIAPLVGRDAYIIRGGSMSPFVPLGSLVIDERSLPADIRPGDVVTVRLHDEVMVTHRVVRIIDRPSGLELELKGDANTAPDPALVPASSVAGRVAAVVPVAGFILATLASPTGMISTLSMLASLVLAIWLLERLEREMRRERPPGRSVDGPREPA